MFQGWNGIIASTSRGISEGNNSRGKRKSGEKFYFDKSLLVSRGNIFPLES